MLGIDLIIVTLNLGGYTVPACNSENINASHYWTRWNEATSSFVTAIGHMILVFSMVLFWQKTHLFHNYLVALLLTVSENVMT